MRILIGTKNPGKMEGVKKAFDRYFEKIEIQGISVDSEVGDQPINEEIFLGAKNRVKNLKKFAKENNIQADYYVAIEAGLTSLLGEWIDINSAVVEDSKGFQTVGTSQGFSIPEKYIKEILDTELGKVMDRIFEGKDLGKGKGGIYNLTHGHVTRLDLVEGAVIMALISHINGEIWR